MDEIKVGTKLKIISMFGEPNYSNKSGVVTHIDDAGQLHGTWGGLALLPEKDKYEIISEVNNVGK